MLIKINTSVHLLERGIILISTQKPAWAWSSMAWEVWRCLIKISYTSGQCINGSGGNIINMEFPLSWNNYKVYFKAIQFLSLDLIKK